MSPAYNWHEPLQVSLYRGFCCVVLCRIVAKSLKYRGIGRAPVVRRPTNPDGHKVCGSGRLHGMENPMVIWCAVPDCRRRIIRTTASGRAGSSRAPADPDGHMMHCPGLSLWNHESDCKWPCGVEPDAVVPVSLPQNSCYLTTCEPVKALAKRKPGTKCPDGKLHQPVSSLTRLVLTAAGCMMVA